MDKLARIIIGGKTYPMKMDINVLQKIQEDYGTINEWERGILGLSYAKDEDGNQIYNKDGEARIIIGEPSIKAIKTALPSMINEGLDIESDETGKEWKPVEEKTIFRECTISFELLAKMIHEEFKRCFETKK